MARVNIQFNADNAAFDNDPSIEICRILRDMADRFESSGISDLDGCRYLIRDINGNNIGRAIYAPSK